MKRSLYPIIIMGLWLGSLSGLWGQDSLTLNWTKFTDNLSHATIFGPYLGLNADGDLNVCGYTSSFGGANQILYLSQFDSLGNRIWEQTFDTPFPVEYPKGLLIDQEGNSYVLVFQASGFANGWRLIKADALGTLLWDYERPPQSLLQVRDFSLAEDNSVVVLAEEVDTNSGLGEVVMIKFSSEGDILWEVEYENGVTTNFFAVRGAIIDNIYQALVLGSGASFLHVDLEDGTLLSNISINGQVGVDCRTFDVESNYYYASPPDALEVHKISKSGDSLWSFRADPPLTNPPLGVTARIGDIQIDHQGNTYFTGYYYLNENDSIRQAMATYKLDTNGEVVWWQEGRDSTSFFLPYKLRQSNDYVVVTGGKSLPGASGGLDHWDQFLVVYDQQGNQIDYFEYDNNNNSYEIGQNVVIEDRKIYVIGVNEVSDLSSDPPILLTQRYDLVPIINATQEVRPQLPDLDILPNPFTEQLVIRDPQGLVHHYRLTNSQGQLMQMGALERDGLISLPSSLAPGIYWLELQNQEGQILQVETVVKQ